MEAGEDLITGLNNESVPIVVQAPVCVVCMGGGFLKCRVRRNHLARDQIFANIEVFQGPLRLGAPEFLGRNIHLAETIRFLAYAE
jgi:hypothetical protein